MSGQSAETRVLSWQSNMSPVMAYNLLKPLARKDVFTCTERQIKVSVDPTILYSAKQIASFPRSPSITLTYTRDKKNPEKFGTLAFTSSNFLEDEIRREFKLIDLSVLQFYERELDIRALPDGIQHRVLSLLPSVPLPILVDASARGGKVTSAKSTPMPTAAGAGYSDTKNFSTWKCPEGPDYKHRVQAIYKHAEAGLTAYPDTWLRLQWMLVTYFGAESAAHMPPGSAPLGRDANSGSIVPGTSPVPLPRAVPTGFNFGPVDLASAYLQSTSQSSGLNGTGAKPSPPDLGPWM